MSPSWSDVAEWVWSVDCGHDHDCDCSEVLMVLKRDALKRASAKGADKAAANDHLNALLFHEASKKEVESEQSGAT